MRVVLVDSSRTVLKAVTRILEARGHDVIPMLDGVEALARIKSDPSVAAVITSAAPLSMSGVELCWEVRLVANNRRSIYVLMMSSSQDWRNVIEALDCGADDFIGKPPVPEELYARLRVAERLNAMQRDLIMLATTDALTGVLNRRAFFEKANEACGRARAGSQLSAMMMDIDHFKRINDLFGHDVGDMVLRAVAQSAASQVQLIGRLGGEEFAVLAEGMSEADTVALANRLRHMPNVPALDGPEGSMTVTCSFGISRWQPGDTVDRLLKRADVALYEAKAAGRNRVVMARTELQRDCAA